MLRDDAVKRKAEAEALKNKQVYQAWVKSKDEAQKNSHHCQVIEEQQRIAYKKADKEKVKMKTFVVLCIKNYFLIS